VRNLRPSDPAHRDRPHGSAGAIETFAADLPGLPDGIAFDRAGNLVVGCYEPSRLLRLSPDGTACTLLAEDPSAHTLCHPTNLAFAGDRLFAANLGRWHIAEVAMDIGAEPLWRATP
jgi:sugar lactone lactonase YvrE